MKKFIVLLVAVGVVALSLRADIYIKWKTHTDPISLKGKQIPAKDDVSELWLSESAQISISEGKSYIIDSKKNVMAIVNHANKIYVETTLPTDIFKFLPPEAESTASKMLVSATVTPGTETKKIGKWNCKSYKLVWFVRGIAMPATLWASTDVPFNFTKYVALYSQLMKVQMRLDDNSVKEMLKIKGVQIVYEMNADIKGTKIHSTSEVMEIVQKPAAIGVYSVPADYTKKKTLSISELQ